MDYADDVYEKTFIYEIKTVLNIFVLFLPLTVFWAVYKLQIIYWESQHLNTDCGVGFLVLNKPLMIQCISPIITIFLIPIFSKILYPNLADCYIMIRPLTRIIVGMFLVAVALIVAGGLEMVLQVSFTSPGPIGYLPFRFIRAIQD